MKSSQYRALSVAAFAAGLAVGGAANAQVAKPQAVTSAVASDQDEQPEVQVEQAIAPAPPGRVANSSVGVVGQRQTRNEPAMGVKSTARVENRIQNRVDSRIRNRIDQTYDPHANSVSPFAVAEDQARVAATPSQ